MKKSLGYTINHTLLYTLTEPELTRAYTLVSVKDILLKKSRLIYHICILGEASETTPK